MEHGATRGEGFASKARAEAKRVNLKSLRRIYGRLESIIVRRLHTVMVWPGQEAAASSRCGFGGTVCSFGSFAPLSPR